MPRCESKLSDDIEFRWETFFLGGGEAGLGGLTFFFVDASRRHCAYSSIYYPQNFRKFLPLASFELYFLISKKKSVTIYLLPIPYTEKPKLFSKLCRYYMSFLGQVLRIIPPLLVVFSWSQSVHQCKKDFLDRIY